ncbi:MAG: hypothetical protein LBS93_00645 [Synergistaceae bacterium]|jgi:hypothetical protein|nr:hypothetical protein [Synergistaceae bacterium]
MLPHNFSASSKICHRVFNLLLLTAIFFILLAQGSPVEASVYLDEDPERMLFVIHIPMTIGDLAQVLFPDGTSLEMGKVFATPTKSRYPGFTASKYGTGAQIIASAVNAHHIQVSVENGEGRTLSLIPSQTFVAASGLGTSFVVDGIGGTGLWGRYAPFVGSPVYIVNQVGIPVLFNNVSLLKFATAIEIRVYKPKDEAEYLEVENVEGGRAWYHDTRGDHQFAIVESPVSGTGRFEGTLYQSLGRVRANHPGVICVSTTDRYDIGGFQIVPLSHTYSKEMQKTRRMSQYIVLRGIDFEDLTGQPPFYRSYIRPGDAEDMEYHGGTVRCKMNGEWRDMPLVSGLTENTLSGVEAFRIYFN